MNKFRTTHGQIQDQSLEDIGFGLFDYKNREIGARVLLQIREMIPVASDEPEYLGFNIEPGSYFTFTPYALRGGKVFGASSGVQYFRNEADRSASVAKYLAGAKRRAVKNAA